MKYMVQTPSSRDNLLDVILAEDAWHPKPCLKGDGSPQQSSGRLSRTSSILGNIDEDGASSGITVRYDSDSSEYIVECPVPGCSLADVQVCVSEGRCEVTLPKKKTVPVKMEEEDQGQETERSNGMSVALPEDADTSGKLRAECFDEVLVVRFATQEWAVCCHRTVNRVVL